MPLSLIQSPQTGITGHSGSFISRWNAIHNRISLNFIWQRQDYTVIGVTNLPFPNPNLMWVIVAGHVALPGGVSPYTPPTTGYIYVNCGIYNGTYQVQSYGWLGANTVIAINISNVGGNDLTGGYANDFILRPNYYVELIVKGYDFSALTYAEVDRRRINANPVGTFKMDLSSSFKLLTSLKFEQDYSSILFQDKNSTAIRQISFLEVWDGSTNTPVEDQIDYYGTRSARQIKSHYGSNLGEYVPYPVDIGQRALFICPFSLPVYFVGFPWDIGFIWSEFLKGAAITLEADELDRNQTGFGHVQDAIPQLNAPCECRLKLRDIGSYAAGTKYLDIWLKINSIVQQRYVDAGHVDDGYVELFPPTPPASPTPFDLTERRRIKIGDECYENPVYLRWKATEGGWGYWLFKYDYKRMNDVKTIANYFLFEEDIELSDGDEEVLRKESNPSITVGEMGIDKIHYDGFVTLMESPRVQLLVNPLTWQTDDGGAKWMTVFLKTTNINSQTKYGTFDVELTIEMQQRKTITQ